MVDQEHVHLSWDEQNEDTNYPFTDASSLRIEQSGTTIPLNAFRDAMILGPNPSEAIYLRSIQRTAENVVLTFRQGLEDIAVATISLGQDGWVPVIDSVSGQSTGNIRIDGPNFASLFGLNIRTYTLLQNAAVLVPFATGYRPRTGITGFRLPDGRIVSGDVLFVAGRGLEFDDNLGFTLNAVGSIDRGQSPIQRPITQLAVTRINEDGTESNYTIVPQFGEIRYQEDAGNPAEAVKVSNPNTDTARFEVTS